jgi:NAD(P)H-flavin reductase
MVWGSLPVQTHVDEEVGRYVCDGFEKVLSHQGAEHVVTCGPIPMMKMIAEACAKVGVSCDVSLEARMACGFGVCLGCVIETKDGYKKVCNEGPVFNGADLW